MQNKEKWTQKKVEKKFYVEEKSKLLSKSLLWDSEACDLTEFFGHHNSSLCATRANVQCILKKWLHLTFFVKWGKSEYCFDSCVAASFEKYQEEQNPR